MTREIALHCMKSYSELHSDLCELCPIYGETGCDHCFEDALQYVIGMLEQEPQTFKWCTDCKEYDQEKHCCHRWSKVIRDTVEEMRQEQEPRWIPVSERLPENKTYVLVTIGIPGRQPHARSGWYQDGFFHNDNGDCWRATDIEVKAWRPLPKPYKPQESEE